MKHPVDPLPVLHDPVRLAALKQYALLDTPPEEAFDRLTRLAARALHVPVSLITLLDDHRQCFKSCAGTEADSWSTRRETPLTHSFCQYVVALNEPLIVDDARQHPFLRDNLAIRDFDVIAYAGIPLTTGDGAVLGSLCVCDSQPRVWTDDEIAILQDAAASVMVLIELRAEALQHQQIEAELRENEKRYHIISELMSDMAYSYVVHPDNTFTREWLVGKYERITGYRYEDVIDFQAYHPDDQARAMQDVDAVVAGKTVKTEYRTVNRDGTVRYAEIIRVPQFEDGRVVRFYGVVRDITERKLAENALQESEKRYHIISELMSDMAYSYVVQPDNTFTREWLVGKYERITGYRNEEANDFQGYLPEDKARAVQDVEAVVAGKTISAEYCSVTKNGAMRYVEVVRVPEFEDGRVVRFYGVVRDITERKLAENALQESEKRYHVISELMSDLASSYVVHPDGAISREWMAGNYNDLTGFKLEEIQDYQVYSPEDKERAVFDVQAVIAGETVKTEYRMLTKSGDFRWVESFRRPEIVDGRVVRFYSAARDITERKRAEEALRESEARYRAISELISDAAFAYVVHPDGSFTMDWIAGSFLGMTGYKGDEIGSTLRLYHPDDTQRVASDLQTVLSGQTVSATYRIITKAGETRWVESYRKPEIADGRVVRFYGAIRDITERKLAETQRLEMEQEKVGMLSRFIGDASHDLRTPLTGIKSSLYLLEKQPDPDKRQRYITNLNAQAQRIENLLAEMLTMSWLDDAEQMRDAVPQDVNALVQAVIEQQSPLVESKGHRLEFSLQGDLPSVYGSEAELEQALMHLLVNALNYTPDGGQIWVETAAANESVTIRVRDSGVGIAPDDLPHIFERFYRGDKARGTESGGTGLGLTIAKKIIELHGGTITVESVPGEGSTFTIALPIDG